LSAPVSGAHPDERLRDAWLAPLATEQVADYRFVSRGDGRKHRRWGPEVMAQVLIAAGRTAESQLPLSLRALFVRPASWLHDLSLEIEPLSDGRRLKTRLVRALQEGKPILTCTVSFGDVHGSLEHAVPAPQAPAPESLRDWWDELHEARPSGTRSTRTFWDLRSRGSTHDTRPAGEPPRRTTWARPRVPLPADPLVHAAAILAVSDTALIHTVGLAYPNAMPTSLDHSIWWHETPNFDDWLLYASSSPAGRGGRALIEAAFYARSGRRIASVAQDCMIP
jgi:acyl-CoA thioesterase-2